MQTFFTRFEILIGILGMCTNCFSQQKTIVGLNVTGEKTSSAGYSVMGTHYSFSDFVVGGGGTVERQFAKHHGLETGLYYRTFDVHNGVFVDGRLFGSSNIQEKYLSVPVLYKFYSSVLNFSVGPTFDVYVGWKKINNDFPLIGSNYSMDNKFHVGWMSKISKTIGITDRILLEPEVRYNPIFHDRRSYYGGGIALKYILTK